MTRPLLLLAVAAATLAGCGREPNYQDVPVAKLPPGAQPPGPPPGGKTTGNPPAPTAPSAPTPPPR